MVVSGTPVVRPVRAARPPPTGPVFGPSARLDIEAEVGFVVGVPSRWASRVAVDDFADHVFGVVLVNDWSARDIQAWEYQPLGPFLGKSFATSVSPWVVPLDALADAWVPAPAQDPPVLRLPARRAAPGPGPAAGGASGTATRVSEPPFAGHVLDPGPAARAPDRQRRLAAYR